MVFILYLVVGVFCGLLSGLFGVGGGLIVVPSLIALFAWMEFPREILMHLAVGSSLGAMVATTLSSAASHLTHTRALIPLFLKYAGPIAIGALLGALLADHMASKVLEVLFGLFVWVIAVTYLWQFKSEWPKKRTSYSTNFVTLTGIGTISSMLGIGAGTLGLPFFHRFEKVSMHVAIGACAALSFCVSIFGTLSYLFTGLETPNLPPHTTGYLYWPAILGINLTSPYFAYLGAHLAQRLPALHLKRLFGVLLIFVGAKMIFG